MEGVPIAIRMVAMEVIQVEDLGGVSAALVIRVALLPTILQGDRKLLVVWVGN